MVNRSKSAEAYTYVGNFLLRIKQIRTICFAFLFSVFSINLFATGQNPNIAADATSASCDNATLETYSGTSNLQANWEANEIKLSWYNEGLRLTVQDTEKTCDYDNSLHVPSTNPTRTGYTFNGWTLRSTLPAGYTMLEYVEATGTQYIDTGILVKSNTLAEFEYQYTATSATNYVFGQVAGSASLILGYRSNRIWWFRSNDVSFLDTARHKVEYRSDGKVYRDEAVVGTRGTFGSTPQNYTILLFAERNDNSAINKGKVKIYKFKLKEDSTLVRNFVPARRNSDSVVGMWDMVSKTFFTNAGSGTFTAGPVVQ